MADIDLQDEDRAVFGRLSSTGHITHGLRRMMTQQWNQCNLCKQIIDDGRPAFAGYQENGDPSYVGACCAARLTELATPVYWSGTLDVSVEENQFLWRYMDFAKFVSMLHQRGLYFTRAGNFKDQFEGAAGLSSREIEWDQHYLDFFRSAIRTPPPGPLPPEKSAEEIDKEAEKLLEQLKGAYSNSRNLLVSCWHANDVESEALWQIYCPGSTPGLAIRTTVSGLWEATSDDPSSVIGRVHYMDFRKSFASGDQRIFCKRSSLRHEREVRAVLANDRLAPNEGRILACELGDLIEEVVVSPFAPSWFGDVVSETMLRFGRQFPMRHSEISEAPFY